MANPPFNVSGVDKDRLKDDKRFALGLPSTDSANYPWIQLFYASLSDTGRAGFVMANSAGDARGSELEIRKKLIQSGDVEALAGIIRERICASDWTLSISDAVQVQEGFERMA